MNQDKTLARWSEGKEEWNKWAKGQIRLKRELESEKRWKFNAQGEPKYPKMRDWIDDSNSSFSNLNSQLVTPTEFDAIIFPHDLYFLQVTANEVISFKNCIFHGDAHFNDCTFKKLIIIENCIFYGKAEFDRCVFLSEANFSRNKFRGKSFFRNANFGSTIHFDKSKFYQKSDFNKCVFEGDAYFTEANFKSKSSFYDTNFRRICGFTRSNFNGRAIFTKAHFEGHTHFENSTFHSMSWFESTQFDSPTSFEGAYFKKETSFRAAYCYQAFQLRNTRFTCLPNFVQSHFSQPPIFDECTYPDAEQERANHKPDVKATHSVSAKYRALKMLAIQGHDHMREIDFFAEELRSKRLMVDKNRPSDWILSGIFQVTSDYGRSIFRPIFWWLPVMLISTALYLSSSTINTSPKTALSAAKYMLLDSAWTIADPVLGLPDIPKAPRVQCHHNLGSGISAAYQLSTSKGLIIPGFADKKLIDQAYKCLYGSNVPFGISWIIGIQTVFSAALLFLFLLGIRNRFKLK